ncbi:hypothetical protein [Paenibacillus sp. FSL R10-2748]|uniref:hypothetical protein n=1 Tax=Paenibacillus sp. FSL R10-2748 TaxID=2954658 RepID=UPI0030FB92DB
MTFSAIKDATRSLKQLYIDSKEVEVLFLDELTETIEVRYINTGAVTFVTKSSLSEYSMKANTILLDDLLILRYREVTDV